MKYLDTIKNIFGVAALMAVSISTGYIDSIFIMAVVLASIWTGLYSYLNQIKANKVKDREIVYDFTNGKLSDQLENIKTTLVNSCDFLSASLSDINLSIRDENIKTNDTINNSISLLNNTVVKATASLLEINNRITENQKAELGYLANLDSFKELYDRIGKTSELLNVTTSKSTIIQEKFVSKISDLIDLQTAQITANNNYNERFLKTLESTKNNQLNIIENIDNFEDKVEDLSNELKKHNADIIDQVSDNITDLTDSQSDSINDLNESIGDSVNNLMIELRGFHTEKYAEISNIIIELEEKELKLISNQSNLFESMNSYLKNNVSELERIPKSLIDGLNVKNEEFKKHYKELFLFLNTHTSEMKETLSKVSSLHDNIGIMNKNDFELVKKYLDDE